MAFYKVTHNGKHDFATVHNYGCTFRCPICSYKLVSGADGTPGLVFPRPEKFLSDEEVKEALRSVSPKTISFMGGEPTVAKSLPKILDFARNELNARTMLGHTNGNNLDLDNLDAANVGLKAWDEDVHKFITGVDKTQIYDNFEKAAEKGIELSANMILIPGLVEADQIEALAEYLSSFKNVKLHIMGYIPVPGQPYRRPTRDEMDDAKEKAEKYLSGVKYSHLSPEEYVSVGRNDDRFAVKVIADSIVARKMV